MPATEAGQEAAIACESKAKRTQFDPIAAESFIATWLRVHGPTPGELLTMKMRQSGIIPAGVDMRCIGPTFARLIKDGTIRVLRHDLPRVMGHGTSGGRLYEAVI